MDVLLQTRTYGSIKRCFHTLDSVRFGINIGPFSAGVILFHTGLCQMIENLSKPFSPLTCGGSAPKPTEGNDWKSS